MYIYELIHNHEVTAIMDNMYSIFKLIDGKKLISHVIYTLKIKITVMSQFSAEMNERSSSKRISGTLPSRCMPSSLKGYYTVSES